MDDLEELGSNGRKPNFTWFWQNLVLHGLGLFLWSPFYIFLSVYEVYQAKRILAFILGTYIDSTVSQESKHRVANLWKPTETPNECQPQLSTVYRALGYFTAKCNSQVRNLQAIYSLSKNWSGRNGPGNGRNSPDHMSTSIYVYHFLGSWCDVYRFFGFLRPLTPFSQDVKSAASAAARSRAAVCCRTLSRWSILGAWKSWDLAVKKNGKIERNRGSSPGFSVSMLNISFKNKETTINNH